MTYCVLDFETKDPNIDTRSWPCGECQVLGTALISSDGKYREYCIDTERTKKIISEYDTIVCHNTQYDCGILVMLGYDIYKHTLVDTKILAKLYNNLFQSTSLEYLGETLLQERKQTAELEKLAHELKERGLIKFNKTQKPLKILYKNMDIAQEYGYEIIEKYALMDAEITEKLYQFFTKNTGGYDVEFYSDLLKCLIKSRAAGVPISEENIDKADIHLLNKMNLHKAKAFEIAGKEFNFNASNDFYQTLLKVLQHQLPISDTTGKYTVTKSWMEKHSHPIFAEILDYKRYDKARRDFVLKLRKYIKDGRIYPSFTPLGADTGRFTCRNPNCQQIPARDQETLDLCRGIFIAPEGHDWTSIDYSSQESRLQVHFAAISNCPGGALLRDEYIKNPELDLHQIVADMCHITRKEAKTINLGLSYGMGQKKLAASLEVELNAAIELKNQYNQYMPYLTYLMRKIENTILERGFVYTLGKRKNYIDLNFAYKGLNFLIQGSAADQTMKAMVECYRAGIDILFSVHDEINFLTKKGDSATIKRVKEIMENCYKLQVPVIAEVKTGSSWAECK